MKASVPTVGEAMEVALTMSAKQQRKISVFRIDLEKGPRSFFASTLDPYTIRVIDGQRLVPASDKVVAVTLVARVDGDVDAKSEA